VVDAEPVERAVDRVAQVVHRVLLRQFAVAGLRVVVEVVADLRGDGHLLAALREHLAEQLLRAAVSVHVARVEVGDAGVERVLDHLQGVRLVAVPPPVRADDPRAEADLAHLDPRIAEFAVVHTRAWSDGHLAGTVRVGAVHGRPERARDRRVIRLR